MSNVVLGLKMLSNIVCGFILKLNFRRCNLGFTQRKVA